MTYLNIKNFESKYTECALTERIKQDLVEISFDIQKYLQKIREHKKNRVSNQNYFDYKLEVDFSIDPDNPEDIKRKIYDNRWYYYKAHHYLKIRILSKPSTFKISLSHLSPQIISELTTFGFETRKYILKQAVAKIFEDINFQLYHNSLSSILEVELVE